jgi:hypothetical protein
MSSEKDMNTAELAVGDIESLSLPQFEEVLKREALRDIRQMSVVADLFEGRPIIVVAMLAVGHIVAIAKPEIAASMKVCSAILRKSADLLDSKAQS